MRRAHERAALQLAQGNDHRVRHYRERDQQGFVAPSIYRFDHDDSPELTSTRPRLFRVNVYSAEILRFEAVAMIAAGLKTA
jgi:hypothetical protein